MQRRFEFRSVPSIPRLAWCARVSRGRAVVVEHGLWVETRGHFFVEGAWSGDFAAGDFARSVALLGSGARLAGSTVAFSTTTHTMERLQSVRVGNELFVSNSLAYLLLATDDSLDPSYRLYERDFFTFLHGYDRATRFITTRHGRTIQLHYHETFAVDSDLAITRERPPQPPSFAGYDEYVRYVQELLRSLSTNALAPERQVQFVPLSTISSGYDSPACTVLAQAIGCSRAITFRDARPDYNPHSLTSLDDSGAAIAKYLGIQVREFQRTQYLERVDMPEAEFIATGNGGDDIVMSVLEDDLPGTLFITGFLGDTLWGTSDGDPSRSAFYAYTFPAGSTLSEFRIRVGFVHVPIPLLTFTRHADIQRISLSAEMEPWRVGGAYDRPIPRRLVETLGVPRGTWATEKKAITQPLWLTGAARGGGMSPASRRDLQRFVRSVGGWTPRTLAAAARARFALNGTRLVTHLRRCLPRAARSRLDHVLGMLGLQCLRSSSEQFAWRLLASSSGWKPHWAIARVKERYAASAFRGHGALGCQDHIDSL
jgi:hypothetical protein